MMGYLITQHYMSSLFLSSLSFLSQFHGHGCANWSSTKAVCTSLQRQRRGKKQKNKKQEHLTPSLPNPISSSNFVCFKWLKNQWMCHLKFYKSFLNSICNRAMFKDLKLQNINYFHGLIIEPLPLSIPKVISRLFLDEFEQFFWFWMCQEKGDNISLSSKGNKRMYMDFCKVTY